MKNIATQDFIDGHGGVSSLQINCFLGDEYEVHLMRPVNEKFTYFEIGDGVGVESNDQKSQCSIEIGDEELLDLRDAIDAYLKLVKSQIQVE